MNFLQFIFLQAIHHIFTNSIMEFYEEAMSLSCDLTTKHVSPDMWKMLEVAIMLFLCFIYLIFQLKLPKEMPFSIGDVHSVPARWV